jgi:hypothetical protein
MKKYQVIINDKIFNEISEECDIELVLAQALPFDGVNITKQSYMNGRSGSIDIVFVIEVDETKIDEPVEILNELCRSMPFDGVIIKVLE